MQVQPRFNWFRRFLFPYTGEEELTPMQGQRIVVSWALFFATVLTLATLPVMLALGSRSLPRAAIFLLCTFLGCLVLFGLMASFVVLILNRSARIRLMWKEQNAAKKSSISGGRYGS